MRLGIRCSAVTSIAVLVLAMSNSSMAQKTGRYAGYGAGIGALVGLVAGGDLGDVAVGAAVGAAGGAATGAYSDSKDRERAAIQEKQRAEQAQRRAEAAAAKQQAAAPASATETADAELVALIGQDNYEAYKAVRECQYKRAYALVQVGAVSDNPDHQLAALWLEAVIAGDQGDSARAKTVYPRIVDHDRDIDSAQQASLEADRFMLEMREERRALGMPSCRT
ncbi:MAG: hypothetical protein WBN48_16130 [Thiogranum sp.]